MTTRHVSTHVTNTSAELNTNVEKKNLDYSTSARTKRKLEQSGLEESRMQCK